MFTIKDIPIRRVDRGGTPWTANGDAVVEAMKNGWPFRLCFHYHRSTSLWWLYEPVQNGRIIRVFPATANKLARDGKIKVDLRYGGYAEIVAPPNTACSRRCQ